MKEFAAFIFLIVLLGVGWNQSYKTHFSRVVGEPPADAGVSVTAPPEPRAVRSAPATTPAPDNSWLWKRSRLDLPAGRTGGDKRDR